MTGNPCMARLHLACRCCRPIGHDGPHNCLHPDGGVAGSDTTARRPLDLDAIRARNANAVNRRDLLALIEEVELVRADLEKALARDPLATPNGDTSWIH